MSQERSQPTLPRYGERSLAELTPSLMAALGIEGFDRNPLGIEPLEGVCFLLVDGLGHEQLQAHADYAPFLSAAAGEREPLTAGFPATTATSIGSLGTGLPPGEHGLVGYTFAVPGHDDRPMNVLLWELYGTGQHVDLSEELPPGRFQPRPTVLELAEQAGLGSIRVGPPEIERSPLSRAVLRGGRYAGAHSMGDRPFKLSDKGVYLMPVGIVMPGEWEVVISVVKEGKVVYAGYHRFKV